MAPNPAATAAQHVIAYLAQTWIPWGVLSDEARGAIRADIQRAVEAGFWGEPKVRVGYPK